MADDATVNPGRNSRNVVAGLDGSRQHGVATAGRPVMQHHGFRHDVRLHELGNITMAEVAKRHAW